MESGSRSNIHEALANYRSGAEMSAPTSRRQTGDGDRPKIHPMPDNPLSLLKKLTGFIKVHVGPLHAYQLSMHHSPGADLSLSSCCGRFQA